MTALADRGLRPAAELAADKPHGTRLRYIGGCKCFQCRRANSDYERDRKAARLAGDWNGFVPADRARAHLMSLSRSGVGKRAVQAASDVCMTVLQDIRTGKKAQIRARTERRILAARLRYKISDQKLVIGYELVRPQVVLLAAIQTVTATIKAQLAGFPLYIGKR